jgi:hypothetical protein
MITNVLRDGARSPNFCPPIMPSRKIKKGRFLNVLKNRPVCSALPSATENNPYAELGIRDIFINNRRLSVNLPVQGQKSDEKF